MNSGAVWPTSVTVLRFSTDSSAFRGIDRTLDVLESWNMEPTDFIDFYTAKMLRKNGRKPAPLTLKGKASSLRVCASITHAETCAALCAHMQGREAAGQVLDVLSARMTPGAMQKVVYALLDLADFARAKGWPVPAVTRADLPGSNPQKPIVVYTELEVATVLAHAKVLHGLRWELFLETLIGTGRRVGEVLGLEWSWLRLDAKPPHFHLPNTKNVRQAYVPLSSALVKAWGSEGVAGLHTPQGRQFGRSPDVYPFPWTYSCVQDMFTRYCKRIDVESRGFHNFRHTKATEMLTKGVPIQAVASLLGHANVATTDRLYNHTDALSYAQYVE